MKVTSYYPVWVVHEFNKDIEEHMEAMGMKIIHHVDMSFKGMNFSQYIYENELGQRLSVSVSDDKKRPEGIYSMYVNVDNFEEGVVYFAEKGYLPSENCAPIDLPDKIMIMLAHKDREKDVVYVVHHKKS